MDNEIENILWDFLRENCLPRKENIVVKDGDNLFNTGVIDSAGLIHFVGFIEKKFNLEIPDDDLVPEKFTSVASIAKYIRSRLEVSVLQN